ncbi:MAG TPA: CocE/NonD family hydrolase [Candidatus Thermoplasmatota archaeon]|nr:CocE/NonD family hydrolase [Candidatus Thermoplasmatota archaeon]
MKKIITIIALVLLVLPVGFGNSTDTVMMKNSLQNLKIIPATYTPNAFPHFKTTYMVPMRDGVMLATDVYRPIFRPSPHGTIFLKTPYNKDALQIVGLIGILYGWPTVIQDMRGRFASGGIDTVFKNESTDGADTLAWIANQTWSNGKIATIGPSALGITQYCMAAANPPNLACQYILVASPNLYKHAVFQGGEFRKNLVERWLNGQQSNYILQEILDNENFTLGYWGNVTLDDNWEDVNVPAIHVGGWYDIFTQGTIEAYIGYQHYSGPGAQGKSKLVIGPWTHTGFFSRTQGELTYPRDSLDRFSLRMFQDMIRLYAMNRTDDFSDWPTVSYYVMGDVDTPGAAGNEWRYADDWPIPFTDAQWYFHSGGLLNMDLSAFDDPLLIVYDPTDPVPTIGGKNLFSPSGPYDQSLVENRSDVLVFTSPVLEHPYEATGPVKARLFVSSDCPDTDFTVKLTDVYPDGRSMFITDGILRMRNRNGQDHWEFMEPGTIYEVLVDLWSTSYIWNTGHRIRVEVSSSNYPRFLNNPNTADRIGKNTTYDIAHNVLYIDSTQPSCIILPEPSLNLTKKVVLINDWSPIRNRICNTLFSLIP